MNKGDIVTVKASVFGSRSHNPGYDELCKHTRNMPGDLEMIREARRGTVKRNLWRKKYDERWSGMVVGYSVRQTGNSVPSSGGYDDYEPGYLSVDETIKVYMVQPTGTTRWLRPIACLEDDLVSEQQAIFGPPEEILFAHRMDYVDCPVCAEKFKVGITSKMVFDEVELIGKCPHCKARLILQTIAYVSAEEEEEI